MPISYSSNAAIDKIALRREMELRRSAAHTQNVHASFAVRDRFLETIVLSSGCVVAAYSARGTEIDPAPLAAALREAGHKIVLPVMAGKDKPLLFRSHDPAISLVRNAAGIWEPPTSSSLMEPDVVIVPLLAFDRHHHRLGAGGGYYDRTLPYLRARQAIMAVGIGFSCQELPQIPVESHDAKLDKIVTELQVF